MAAASLLLRSLRMASTERVFRSPGSTLYLAFVPHFIPRGQQLPFRTFSARAVKTTEPETRVSKKGRNPSASWEEAGELFFSSKNKKIEKEDDSWERTVLSVEESVRNRSNGSHVQEERAEKERSSSKFVRNKGISTDTSDGGKLNNGQRSYGKGRDSMARSKVGDEGRRFSDVDGGAYKKKGFREEFTDSAENRRYRRGNLRNDADSRGGYRSGGFREEFSDTGGFREEFSERGDGRMTYRSNARGGGFREEFSDGVVGRGTYRSKDSDGGFRKQSSDSNDRSRGFFKNQRGTLGKRQFPDLDGGKRLFKGRFEGNGFVRKQPRDIEDEDSDEEGNSTRGSYRASTRGNHPVKHVQAGQEAYALSEDDDDESEDFPEAGDVIKYSNMAKEKNRRRYNGGKNTSDENVQEDREKEDYEEDEEEEEDEGEDEDENTDRSKGFGVGRRTLSARGSSLPRMKGEVVYGVGPVYAALQISRREFFCLYVQANMPIGGGNASKKKDKKAFEWIIRSAIDKGLEVKEISKHDLNMLADNRPHQGLILDASPLHLVVSSGLDAPFQERGKEPVWVALDEVMDPQNFGAILRSSYFLGAAGVVVCAKNSAPLSAVVSKASAGALEVMELRSCKNMMKFLDRSAENGWRVVGGSSAGVDVTPVRELPRGVPTILVLGGEGKGLRTNVRRSCSKLVCIPGIASAATTVQKDKDALGVDREGEDEPLDLSRGKAREDFVAVESLNVSVAAGILLHELLNGESAAESSTSLDMAEASDECESPVSQKQSTLVNDEQESSFVEANVAEIG